MSPAYRQRLTVAGVARAFGFLALLVPAAWAQDEVGLLAVGAVGVVWLVAFAAESSPHRLVRTTEVLSAGLVAAICGIAVAGSPGSPGSTAAMGALAISPLTAGVLRGTRIALLCLLASSLVLTVLALLAGPEVAAPSTEAAVSTLTWTLTGLGLGFIGSFLHGTLLRSDPLATQRRVQSLIRLLIDESDHLVGGLGPETLGGQVLERVREVVPAGALLLQAPHDGVLAPVALDAGALAPPDELATVSLADRAYAEARPIRSREGFALPLTSEGRVVAVVSGWFLPGVDGLTSAQPEQLDRLAVRLEGSRPSSSRRRCSSRPSGRWPRWRSADASPASCTTVSPRTWRRSAT